MTKPMFDHTDAMVGKRVFLVPARWHGKATALRFVKDAAESLGIPVMVLSKHDALDPSELPPKELSDY